MVRKTLGSHKYTPVKRKGMDNRYLSVSGGTSKKGRWMKAAGLAGEAYNAGKYLATGNYVGAAMDYVPRIASAMFGKKKSATRNAKYSTQGAYKGSFRKGRRNTTSMTLYANKGVLLTSEISGTVSDPDCVYISHTACDTEKVITQMCDALFRKLFEKGGFNVTNLDDVIGSTSISTGVDWTVQLTEVAGQTGVESVNTTYTTLAASTVRSVSLQFHGAFKAFSAGYAYTGAGAAGTDTRLYRLILYHQDYNVTYGKVFKCAINLPDEVVRISAYSELKIQNRTLAADAGADEDNVSNNPLVGRSYQFATIPKTRDRSLFPLNAIRINSGVQLARSAQLGSTGYKEPPTPSVFTNCRSSTRIRLEPGDVKMSKIYTKKSINMLILLGKLNLQSGITPAFNAYHSIFPCEIFAFEDVINVNNSQNISCAYEANQVIGVYLKTKKKASAVVSYTEATQSNVP